MPLNADHNGTSGTNINVGITNTDGGDPTAAQVDVLISWDPDVLEYDSSSPARDRDVMIDKGVVLWTKTTIRSLKERTFKVNLTKAESGRTYVLVCICDPRRGDLMSHKHVI